MFLDIVAPSTCNCTSSYHLSGSPKAPPLGTVLTIYPLLTENCDSAVHSEHAGGLRTTARAPSEPLSLSLGYSVCF